MVQPSLPPVAFWYLRHGETDWNRDNRTQGRTDIPINATGMEQIRQAAAALAGKGIARIVTSPLGRARSSADIAASILNVPVMVEPDLQEANFGEHEGEVMAGWFHAWVAGQTAPERGESFATLRARAVGVMRRILQANGLVLVVSHGAFFRAVRAEMGLSPNIRTSNGEPILCQPVAGGGWRLVGPGGDIIATAAGG
jgi:probable phosphoglycerate mutase